MNDMGSCSFAGLRDRGSFLQLFSVESGFCSRARTMGSSAAGWHRRRSAQHCQGGSVAICYLVVSSTFSHCPQPHQETGRVCAFTALQLWLFLNRKTDILRTGLALECWKLDYLNIVWTPTQPLYFSFTKYFTDLFITKQRQPQQVALLTCASLKPHTSPHVPVVWLVTLQAKLAQAGALHSSLQQF